MRMKRALLIGPLPPLIGGDTVSTMNLLKSGYWRESGIDIESINTCAKDRIRIPGDRLSIEQGLRAVRILARVFLKIPTRDVVLLWGNSRFICTLGIPIMIYAVMVRKPFIVKVFGAYLAERLRNLPRPVRAVVTGLLGRARFVLPQTGRLESELVDGTGIPASRVVSFPNFLADDALGSTLGEKRFSGRCVFVGQIKREKGVFDIIDALKGRNDLGCDFYGQIVERDRRGFIDAVGSSDRLSYRGVIEPGGVIDVIRRFDVLLLPTYHIGEGYPGVILQAFAAGTAVIASDWLSIPDLVEDGARGVLVPVKAPGRITGALDMLASDRDLFDTVRRKAFEFVKSFSEERIVRDILIRRVEGILGRAGD